MSVEVTRADTGNDADAHATEEIKQLMRDFANWIYRQLEDEYRYQTSDVHIDQQMRDMEYNFTAEGRRSVTL
jgi:hypothetical protein